MDVVPEGRRLSDAGPLRVCLLVPYDLSTPGGGVKHHVFQLAEALRRGGDEVTVIGPANRPVSLPGVYGFGGVANVESNGSDNRLGLFVLPWRVRRFFRRNRFDVIHVHEPLQPSLAYYTCWFTAGVPKICTFHAFSEKIGWALRAGRRFWSPLQLPFFDRGIAVSQAAARYAGATWRRPIEIIPNGVPTTIFRAAPPGPAGGPLRLLFVGRLGDARKGFSIMLEAYRRMQARGLSVTLDVAGEQAGAPELPALPGLTYHGAVSLDALVHRYRACDVFVAPSTGQESFGIVLLEAMSTGRAVVCSDIAGYREVADPRGARLVPPGDPEALAAAVASLAGRADDRARMGEANTLAAARYDWDRLAPQLRDQYRMGIDARRGLRPGDLARPKLMEGAGS